MSRTKNYYENPGDKVQRTARKIIQANGYRSNLEQAYAHIKYKRHDLDIVESFNLLLHDADERLVKLMQKLIDRAPWWSKFHVDDTLTIKVRMTDGELIHFKTRYGYHHQLVGVKIDRFMD